MERAIAVIVFLLSAYSISKADEVSTPTPAMEKRSSSGRRQDGQNVPLDIRVIWRSVLDGTAHYGVPSIKYSATDCALDFLGNTVVAGKRLSPSEGVYAGAFIAKLSSHGEKLWEYDLGTNCCNGVESVAVDRRGNIAFSTTLTPYDNKPLALVKLSPDGQELWREELQGVEAICSVAISAVRFDRFGNVYLLTLLQRRPNPAETELCLSKFSPKGKRLWSSTLPGLGYGVISHAGLSKCLSVLPDGSALVTGMLSFKSFVAKLDSKGRLLWWVYPVETDSRPESFVSVMGGRFGLVCASGMGAGFCVLSANGNLLKTGNTLDGCGGDVLAVTRSGGFLVGCGTVVAALDSRGNLSWEAITRLFPFGGAASVDRGGWLAVGGGGGPRNSTAITYLDEQGDQAWSTRLPEEFTPGGLRKSIYRAPDGTFRLITQLKNRNGIPQSRAFGVEVIALEPVYAVGGARP